METISFEGEPSGLVDMVVSLRSRLPEFDVSAETLPSGNFFIDVKKADDFVVIEGRPNQEEYGVTKNPELFAGSDQVFSDPQAAIDAVVHLFNH